jgi:hypothetical protein
MFEQQSLAVEQRSQAGRHPGAGAQRLIPSVVATQVREQHSSLFLQTSPTCLAQPFGSAVVHWPSAAQCDAPDLSGAQVELQQSAAVKHSSP